MARARRRRQLPGGCREAPLARLASDGWFVGPSRFLEGATSRQHASRRNAAVMPLHVAFRIGGRLPRAPTPSPRVSARRPC